MPDGNFSLSRLKQRRDLPYERSEQQNLFNQLNLSFLQAAAVREENSTMENQGHQTAEKHEAQQKNGISETNMERNSPALMDFSSIAKKRCGLMREEEQLKGFYFLLRVTGGGTDGVT